MLKTVFFCLVYLLWTFPLFVLWNKADLIDTHFRFSLSCPSVRLSLSENRGRECWPGHLPPSSLSLGAAAPGSTPPWQRSGSAGTPLRASALWQRCLDDARVPGTQHAPTWCHEFPPNPFYPSVSSIHLAALPCPLHLKISNTHFAPCQPSLHPCDSSWGAVSWATQVFSPQPHISPIKSLNIPKCRNCYNMYSCIYHTALIL